jgi:hypothetical protein
MDFGYTSKIKERRKENGKTISIAKLVITAVGGIIATAL